MMKNPVVCQEMRKSFPLEKFQKKELFRFVSQNPISNSDRVKKLLKQNKISPEAIDALVIDKDIGRQIIRSDIDPALFYVKFMINIHDEARKQMSQFEDSEKINELYEGKNFEGDLILEQ